MRVDPTLDAARIPSGDGVEPAAVAANFNAGYLISDYAFFNRTAMSEAEIQAFLESKSGTCLNTLCLDILRQDSVDWAATPRCDAYTGGTQELISRIIYKVQIACGVSAKVLLVTLQKEQGLVTSTNPTTRAVNYALGYGCPDTAPCDPAVAGISQQLYRAAAQFQRYRLSPTSYNFQVGVENIQYHPNTACGTKRVTIINQATAGLYNYTPYTPNAAALNNLYGLGDSCSSYGNRNFWRLYTDWFGSPTTLVPSGVQTSRLAGADRYATAVEISEFAYSSGSDVVYLAVGSNFPDGLAAAPAATKQGGPLLLVARTAIPAVVAAELVRLDPSRAVIVGSEAVVSDVVSSQLRTLLPGVVVERDAGLNRYQTAIAVSQRGFSSASVAFIATGENFPDALAASAAAGYLSGPVLLVRSTQRAVDDATAAELARLGVSTVYIAGSTAVVTAELESSLRALPGVSTVERLQGRDRFATAAAVNARIFEAGTHGFIASGMNFPDALSAAAAAGAMGAPLHLSNGVCTPTASLQQLVDAGVTRVAFAGGTGVLRSTVTEFLTCG
ncbi:MAG: cell wall-binding repeat-containing protein [Microcella sp.]